MLESLNTNTFEYTKLSPEEQKQRGILGRLVGVIADFKHPTRNGRLYSEELWENVFNDPIMQEKIKNRCVFGELGHPESRFETDMEKIAICLAEKPKKCKDGTLRGIFDILDTPNGRILKTMCDYGCTIGISSRGQGDVLEDYSDTPKVDPTTYQCECWDAVLVPGVTNARLSLVNESLGSKNLKQALNEQLEQANEAEKKVMTETLDNLNIEYTSEKSIDNNDIAANDDGANIIKQLQESLLEQRKLETQITELQEKLSVSYAKEAKYEEDIAKYKNAIRNLSESSSNAKALQSKVDSLNEELKAKDSLYESLSAKHEKLLQKQQIGIETQNKLTESISAKSSKLAQATEEIKKLNESIEQLESNFANEKNTLEENLAEVRKNLSIKSSEYTTKLANANNLVEQYRTTAKTAVNKYIDLKATMLGVQSNEILNKLPNNYSFADIDQICESLSDLKLTYNSLPFNVNKQVKATVKESIEPIMPKNRFDDTVDASLLRLANLD